jgi:hypothetical protein
MASAEGRRKQVRGGGENANALAAAEWMLKTVVPMMIANFFEGQYHEEITLQTFGIEHSTLHRLPTGRSVSCI